MANLLNLIAASAAPLDARGLSIMLHDMEDTPCCVLEKLGSEYVVWPRVWYEGVEYILIQMPNDDLVALQGQREFWIGALGLIEAEEVESQPEEEDEEPCNCDLCVRRRDE